MQQIPDNALNEIRDRLSLLEIISEYVVLQNKGAESVGLCPFHNEKSPSFSVNEEKGVFYCFGCGEKGDAIAFLMQINSTSFIDTVLDLADRYGVDTEQQEYIDSGVKHDKQQLAAINQFALDYFQDNLVKSNDALLYLKERGLSEPTIKQWGLGYAGADWQELSSKLLLNFNRQTVIDSGLVGCKNERIYDLFRDRLMIPINNERGEAVGFSGRSLNSDRGRRSSASPAFSRQGTLDNKPKYLNTPQTCLFDKKQVAFGLDKAKAEIKRRSTVVLVEGNFDVISLHQAGIENAIATMGTAVDSRLINKLAKDNDIILAFDNDEAGRKTVEKIIDRNSKNLRANLINFKVLKLPRGVKDLDEVLQTPNGKTIARQLIGNAPNWIDWSIKQTIDQHNLDDPKEHKQCVCILDRLLNKIEDLKIKAFYLDRCSSFLSKGNDLLKNNYLKILTANTVKRSRDASSRAAFNFVKFKSNSSPSKVGIFQGLEPNEAQTLLHELSLCQLAIFNPMMRSQIQQRLARLNWSIRDPLCRWLLSRLLSDNSKIIHIELKNELLEQLANRELFKQIDEFINLDYYRDGSLLKVKLKHVYGRPPNSAIAMEDNCILLERTLKGLEKIQTTSQINSLELLLKLEGDRDRQNEYLQRIVELKKSLI